MQEGQRKLTLIPGDLINTTFPARMQTNKKKRSRARQLRVFEADRRYSMRASESITRRTRALRTKFT